MENRQKVLNMIGLATKAGKTVSGEFSTEKAVKTGKAWLVIVSEEASDNTRKMFTTIMFLSVFLVRRKNLDILWVRSFALP